MKASKPVLSSTAPRKPTWSDAKAPKCYQGQQEVRQVRLTLAGQEGPEAAGLLLADKRGYFADAGLTVEVWVPETPIKPIGYVIEGWDDLGVAPQPQVALARKEGAPIVAFGSMIDRPTAAMIWLPGSGLDAIADLEGKTIGIPGLSFQVKFLEVALAQAGLTIEDVTVKRIKYDLVQQLIDGEVDAIFGGSSYAEGLDLKSRGQQPVVTPVESLGVPPYEEMVFFARTDCVAQHPEIIRGFLRALRRGTAAALQDPAAAVRAIQASEERDPDLTGSDLKAGMKTTLPLLSTTNQMDSDRAGALLGWMRDQEMIYRHLPVSELQTNKYLP
jgi:putative hydroxymethylpyrimidine transport system substrate-binding protein